jgi:hypothetical protein
VVTLTESSAVPLSSEDVETDVYLTDGLRLFRVVRGFTWPIRDSWAVLEDCLTLAQYTYAPDELGGLGLSIVRSGPSAL